MSVASVKLNDHEQSALECCDVAPAIARAWKDGRLVLDDETDFDMLVSELTEAANSEDAMAEDERYSSFARTLARRASRALSGLAADVRRTAEMRGN